MTKRKPTPEPVCQHRWASIYEEMRWDADLEVTEWAVVRCLLCTELHWTTITRPIGPRH